MSYLTCCWLRPLASRMVQLDGKRRFASANKLVEVSLNKVSGVSTVTLNRPPVNSLSFELLQQIGDTIDDLEKNESRGMILMTALPTVFSAGLDLTEMYKPDPAKLETFWKVFQNMWLKLYGTSFPTVAAISGHAPAGGCLIALSCDYRIMIDSPKFTIGINDTKVGIVVPSFVQKSMMNVIGTRQTELALTSGKLFSVSEAFKVGLIDEIAMDKLDIIKRAESYLNKFAHIVRTVFSLTKVRSRQDTLDWFIQNKDRDLKFYVEWFQKSEVQNTLKLILEKLGSKKK